MGALAGWYGNSGRSRAVLARMTASMKGLEPVQEEHISPLFAAGTMQPGLAGDIRRLAVSEDGQTVVAFAGYLYTEDSGQRTAPAEHCLRLFRQLGIEFAIELNGTFAIAIADHAQGKLHLMSDRLSTRPIYYAEHKDGLLFATEVKAILAVPGFSPTLDEERLLEFLAMECVTGCRTLYDDIHKVPPGSILTWDGDQIALRRYWSPTFTWDEKTTVRESAERIAESLRAAMRRIASGHGRCGLMLSGGLDSRAIAAAVPIRSHCMTMHTHEDMEVRTSRRVAEALGHQWEHVRLPSTYPLEILPEGASIADGLCAFHHAQGLYLRPRIQNLRLPMMLNGWILGSMLAGPRLTAAPRHGIARIVSPRLVATDDVHAVEAFLETCRCAPIDSLTSLVGGAARDLMDSLRLRMGHYADGLQRGCRNAHDLVDLLGFGDMSQVRSHLNVSTLGRMTMEAIPAWDNEVFDTFLSMPPSHRFNHVAYRKAITLLSPGVARIPYSSTGVPVYHGPLRERWQAALVSRVRKIEAGLASRVTSFRRDEGAAGAWPSMARAICQSPEWESLLRARIDESALVQMGLVLENRLREIVDAQVAGCLNSSALLGTWLTLEEWLRQHH